MPGMLDLPRAASPLAGMKEVGIVEENSNQHWFGLTCKDSAPEAWITIIAIRDGLPDASLASTHVTRAHGEFRSET